MDEFSEMVSDLMRRNPRMDREAAVDAVATAHPEAHRQYLLDTNPDPAAQRLLAEKYGRDID